MTNREIVDYILSNKLKQNDVIKRTEHYYNSESVTYIWNDEFYLYSENGVVSVLSFKDEKPSLDGNINIYYTYEIISKEQAESEIKEKEKNEQIERLEEELKKLKGE